MRNFQKTNMGLPMHNSKLIIIVAVFLLFGCSDKTDNINHVKLVNSRDLVSIDSLIYINNDKDYIGGIRDFEIVDDTIFISDIVEPKIHILDSQMKYSGSFGKLGHGPNEFAYSPYLSSVQDTLVIYDLPKRKLLFYKSNKIVNEITLPPKFFYNTFGPFFSKNKIVITALNKYLRELTGDISDFTTILITDRNGVEMKETGFLLDDYYKNRNLLYYARKNSAIISKGFKDDFFSLQLATYKIQEFDFNGNVLRTFEYKPKYYLTPPKLPTDFNAIDMKKWYESFYSKYTNFYGMFLDDKNNLLYVGYRRLHSDQYLTRTFLDADNYLFVMNEKGECVFDEKTDGYVLSVYDGIIYLLTEEAETRLVIHKYMLGNKSEN